jgi:hypothetical protein
LFDSRDPARPSEALNSEPAYSGSFEPSSLAAFGSTTYSTAALETLPTAAASTIVADAPIPVPNLHDAKPEAAASARGVDANGRRVNRRKHMRIRVNFSACVRHAARGDEIVECVNVSKGGLCFHSRRQYAVDSLIEIAAPYSPGEAALFVVARIKRVEPLSGGQVFRYGVAYVKPSSPGSSF